jgi:DNA-binding response OmpR family regulator
VKVLLVEDEQKIADFVCGGLAARGTVVTHCADGNAGYAAAQAGGFDAIVLDLMLPGRDGLSVLRGLRSAGVHTPVILLTARNELGDRIEGLNDGADDYMAKPFFVEELHARLQALRRRLSGERQSRLQAGGYTLDRLTRHAGWQGSSVELTAREHALLALLMRAPGQVSTRSQILEHVWGYDFDPNTNVVDVCVKRLRAKLAALVEGPGDDGGNAAPQESPIESVRGAGYRFRA